MDWNRSGMRFKQPPATLQNFYQRDDLIMDFKFSPEEQDIIDMLREFSVKEVAPIAAEIDETERFPQENVAQLAEMGMMGLPFPEEFG